MIENTRDRIRYIFLSVRPNVALMQAAMLLEMTFQELKREIANGSIVAVSTRLGQRIPREEMIAAAMCIFDQATIEEALGEDAASVLPEAIRLVELRARVPRYQRDMLRVLADKQGTTVDAVLPASSRTSPVPMPRSWRRCPDSERRSLGLRSARGTARPNRNGKQFARSDGLAR